MEKTKEWGGGLITKITTQAELDALCKRDIKCDEYYEIVDPSLKLNSRLVVYGYARVSVGKSKYEIVARKGATLSAHGDTVAYAEDGAKVYAYDDARVTATDHSVISATGNASVTAYENAYVCIGYQAKVTAWDNAVVFACDGATAETHNNATAKAFDRVAIKAYDNSVVTASERASVEAYDFSIIRKQSDSVSIDKRSDFAVIVEGRYRTTSKTVVFKKLQEDLIATLEIPKGAEFQSSLGDECRTARAKVLKIVDEDGNEVESGRSSYDETFVYEVGKYVEAPYREWLDECAPGIHFFLRKEKAEQYS